MSRLALVLAALFAAACATTPAEKPLPRDAAHITGDTLAELVARPPPPPVPVPYVPLPKVEPMALVLVPVPDKPIVSVRLVFRTGSVDDPPGKEGLTALTTRVLVEGGTTSLSSSELLDALYPMAAELSGDTDKEFTTLAGRVHVERLPRFLEILSEVLLEPRFEPKEFSRLHAEQLSLIRTRLRGENDEELGKAGLDALLYPKHPYGHFTGGTEKGLEAITLDDVKAHWKNVFTQDRLIIGLAGGVDDALAQQVKQALSALPPTGVARQPLPSAPGIRGAALIIQRDTLSTAGSFGFSTTMRRDNSAFFALMMTLSYFGEHRQEHGVLFQEVRDKRGLNYGTYAYAQHFRQDGWSSIPLTNIARSEQDVSIWLRPVEAKHGLFATRAVLHFLDQLRNSPIPPERFETARGFLIGATRQWVQTDQRRLGWAIDDVIYGTQDFLGRLRQALEAMTPEQVQATARRELDPDLLNFVFVTKDAEGLRAALVSQAPTPITYSTSKPAELLATDKQIASTPIPVHPGLLRVVPASEFMRE
ncbi:MAG: pitrilysin family protein [Myxococcota bacterium]